MSRESGEYICGVYISKREKHMLPEEMIVDAYFPSKEEYLKYYKKFVSFMVAKLSKKAKDQGTFTGFKPYLKEGYYPLRAGEYALPSGWYGYRVCNGAGLRVAFQLSYDLSKNIVKGCIETEQTSWIYSKLEHGDVLFTNAAPIITLQNGTKCIWLNKTDCENGDAKTMELWTLELVERAVNPDYDDYYEDLKKIHDQCSKWLKENLSEEELSMVAKVKMSKADHYEKVEPILEEKNVENDELENKTQQKAKPSDHEL